MATPEGYQLRQDEKNSPEIAGEKLRQALKQGGMILLDADAVILEQDSLGEPKLTDENLVMNLMALEDKGVKLGLATARAVETVEWLRKQGMKLEGPSILENGQAILEKGTLRYLDPEFIDFVKQAAEIMASQPGFNNDWKSVLLEGSGFCRGNRQWQGLARVSWWFKWNSEAQSKAVLATVFQTALSELAAKSQVDLSVCLGLSPMKVRDNGVLAIVSLVGAINGKRITKSDAAERLSLDNPVVFIADGDGDTGLGKRCQEQQGLAVIIGGSLDLTHDPSAFDKIAKAGFNNPAALSDSLGRIVAEWYNN